jgi:hypothetical protein
MAGTARSFSWCEIPDPYVASSGKGWSRCFISGTANSRAGNALGNFYRDERVLEGDRFRVGFGR